MSKTAKGTKQYKGDVVDCDHASSVRIIIIIIMKIIYIAPNPLKGSRRFTKSVTATLHHKSSTIKYKHIFFSCILMNQMYQWERNSNTKLGLEKVDLKVHLKLTFTLGFSDIRL